MQLPTDPFMLLSVVNMHLRDDGVNLDEFCRQNDIDRVRLEERLRDAGFEYNPQTNSFR